MKLRMGTTMIPSSQRWRRTEQSACIKQWSDWILQPNPPVITTKLAMNSSEHPSYPEILSKFLPNYPTSIDVHSTLLEDVRSSPRFPSHRDLLPDRFSTTNEGFKIHCTRKPFYRWTFAICRQNFEAHRRRLCSHILSKLDRTSPKSTSGRFCENFW